jgi:hypothetical protein
MHCCRLSRSNLRLFAPTYIGARRAPAQLTRRRDIERAMAERCVLRHLHRPLSHRE